MERTQTIHYQQCMMAELTDADRQLMETAIEATNTAYAPYSNFHVGAALRLDDGTVVTGSNQENIAYPSGLCAERTALFAAGAQHPGKTWPRWRRDRVKNCVLYAIFRTTKYWFSRVLNAFCLSFSLCEAVLASNDNCLFFSNIWYC